jgi:Zinc carboxypeptidase
MAFSCPLSTVVRPFSVTPAHALLALALTVVALFAAAPAARGASLLSTTVSAGSSAQRQCFAQPVSGAGVVSRIVQTGSGGIVSARLAADSGDWDVAVFEQVTGRVVAASAGFRNVEVAQGFVGEARRLVVQACRLDSAADTARLTVNFAPIPEGDKTVRSSLVRVSTPTLFDRELLNHLALDLTEHGGPDFVEVVLHGDEDAQELRDAGLDYEVEIPDLEQRDRQNALRDIEFAAATSQSQMPSGVDSYRHLWEHEYALKEIVRHWPKLARPLTLPFKTNEGRQVHGVEVTLNPKVQDGKPVFAQMGVHHAREWPSAEHTIEFAFDLARNYGSDPRITNLVRRTRTVFVPVVNPDGFNLSREAPVDLKSVTGVGANNTAYSVMSLAEPFFAYKRRNCRPVDRAPAPPPTCGLTPFRYTGVDPNRNYGGLWGGGGASALPTDDTYRGAGPFSEPETQNIRSLVSTRQVTTLITNHTFSNLVLRPPGIRAMGQTPDENVYKDLGDRMASQNGYKSQFSYQLYDTTGTTEDWSYYATGGLGFTFEIGPDEFHPPFETVVDLYRGTGAYAGKGNREAYLLALESTNNVNKHALLHGSGPPGSKLTLSKSFVTETSPVRPAEIWLLDSPEVEETALDKQYFEDRLETSMTIQPHGRFAWHVNPSTRPIVEERRYPGVAEEPHRSQTWENTEPTGIGEHIDKEFTITEADAARLLRVTVEWPSPDDYDLEIYRRLPDGTLEDQPGSGNPPGAKEEAFVDNPVPGDYILRVVNFAAVSPAWTMKAFVHGPGPDIVVPGTNEFWTLTCETPDGQTFSQKIYVERGQRLGVDRPCADTSG